jgi:MFS family permease
MNESTSTGTDADKPTAGSHGHWVHGEVVDTTMKADVVHSELTQSAVAYGPNGIRGLFSSGYVFGAAFVASLGGFSFGYDQGVISIINVMDQFHSTFPQTETAFGTGFMTGMLLLGAFVGCLFMPYLADKISRKFALTVVVVIFNIGAIIQTAAQSYGMLVAGRAIGGIGVGTLAMVRLLLSAFEELHETMLLTWHSRQRLFIYPKSLLQTSVAPYWSWNPFPS